MLDEEAVHVTNVADEIEKYLQSHPKAADTLDGIAKCWLSRIRVEETDEIIAKALEILERQGSVSKIVSVDGREIYSRPKM